MQTNAFERSPPSIAGVNLDYHQIKFKSFTEIYIFLGTASSLLSEQLGRRLYILKKYNFSYPNSEFPFFVEMKFWSLFTGRFSCAEIEKKIK